MKKYFLLLLVSAISFSQTAGATKFKIKENTEKTAATRILVQDATTGEVGYVNKTTIATLDATTTATGKIQLAGDLSGTATAPTVPALLTKEPIITSGTTSQYFRGDKTWQTLDKTAVGLGNVDNTSDLNKPISTATQTALNTKENTANKNTANGYAGLGSDGKLISSQLPSITISDTFVVGSQSAMLAVTAETGDVAVRTDLNKSFILKGTNPAVLADWQELLSPTSTVTSVFGRTGAVTAQSGDYTTAQVTETTNKKYQTDNQSLYNDATSSIQTQLNNKAIDANVVHLAGTETITGTKTFSSTLNSNSVFNAANDINVNKADSDAVYSGSQIWLSQTYTGIRSGIDHSFNIDTYNSGSVKNAFKILQNGNIGIGTVPNYKLHVYGDSYTDGNLKGYLSGQSAYRTYSKAAQFEISSYQIVGGNPYTKIMDIVSNADSGVSSEMRFLTAASGSNPSEAMRITSTGNVGIGTTAPNTLMELSKGGGNAILRITNSDDGAQSTGVLIGNLEFYSKDADSPKVMANVAAVNEEQFGRSGYLSFGTAPIGSTVSEKMRITSGGILQVSSGDIFGGNLASDYGNLTLRGGYGSTTGSASKIEVKGYEGGGGTQGAIISYTNGAERMRIFQSGNVFIGSSPTDAGYKLDINGTARVQSAIGVNATPNANYPITIGCTSGASGLKIIGRSDNLGYIEFFNANGTTVNSSLNGSSSGLQITGATTFSSSVTATAFYQSSDLRLKDIISRDGDVIKYKWKDKRDDKIHIGYVAQEVQKENPDQVNADDKGILSVNYIEILVEKIRKLEKEIELLKAK